MSASRLRRHFFLAASSLTILITSWFVGAGTAALDRVSTVSAYLFFLSISLVLLIGPWRALRTGRATTNDSLRRDVAIWSAINGLVHLIAGAMQSMTPGYLNLFITHAVSPPPAATRELLFLWSTVAGFVIGVLLLILLALSNNRSLAIIGQRRWKRLHRLSYLIFILTILHGFGFQILESRFWVGYALVVTISLVVLIAQALGFLAVSGRK